MDYNVKSVTYKVLRCILFFLPLFILLILLSMLFQPKNNGEEYGMEEERANGIMAEPADTIDVLIVGDSESYSAFSPLELWEDYGITSYVCGTGGQRLYKTYDYLVKAFQTQSPKLVVLETNALYRKIKPREVLSNHIANIVPVFRYHDRWKSIRRDDFYFSPNYTKIIDYKGYFPRKRKKAVKEEKMETYMQETEKSKRLKRINLYYLKKIRKLCGKRRAKLILVSTPSTKNWNYSKHNGIQQYARKHRLTYLDMNMFSYEIGIDWATDSIDGGDHLNYNGATKSTDYFGSWLMERYDLPDHREDRSFQSWYEYLNRYREQYGTYGNSSNLQNLSKGYSSGIINWSSDLFYMYPQYGFWEE